ncbi:MAG: YhjD/YihY/BrkB family envelope integrity protein [Acidimicrobiales bacterium]
MLERLLFPLTSRFRWADVALNVYKRFGQVQGGPLASYVTLAAFLSLFPLLLVAIAVLGALAGKRDIATTVIDQLSLTDQAADFVRDTLKTASSSKKAASIVGLGGLLWSGLGLVNTLETAFGAVWQSQGRGLKDKAFALLWLVGATLLLVASVAATAAAGFLPGFLTWLSLLPTLLVDVAIWLWTFKALTSRQGLPWRAHLPGAILGAVGLELLKVLGGVYVPRVVGSSSALYGSLGVVFALIAWLALFGQLCVYAACLNVVHWEERHGTVHVDLEVPNVPATEDPVAATRAGRALPTT